MCRGNAGKTSPDVDANRHFTYFGPICIALMQACRCCSLTTQYQESDFAFAERLMNEEGLFHYFEHSGDPDSPALGAHTYRWKPFVAIAEAIFTVMGYPYPSQVDLGQQDRACRTNRIPNGTPNRLAPWVYRYV